MAALPIYPKGFKPGSFAALNSKPRIFPSEILRVFKAFYRFGSTIDESRIKGYSKAKLKSSLFSHNSVFNIRKLGEICEDMDSNCITL